jgi:hypothetical protein
MAETLSASKLKEALKSEIRVTEAQDAKQGIVRLSFKLEGDIASLVTDAFTVSYHDLGKEDGDLALGYITSEWLVARRDSNL